MATIRKRGDTYQIRVSCGYDTTGKQITRTKTWKPERDMTEKQKEKELQRIAVLFEEQCSQGLYLDSSMKFATFSDIWLKDYAEKQLRATTVFNYRNMMKTINKGIGHLRMDRIQPHHLMSFYDELQRNGKQIKVSQLPSQSFFDEVQRQSLSKIELSRRAGVGRSVITSLYCGERISFDSARKLALAIQKPIESVFKPSAEGQKSLSGKTVLNHHRLISSVLETAVKWQIILANPCDRVQSPKAERKEARYLDEKEATEILRLLQNEPIKFRAMITLLLYSGMRRGELCGLTWGDIDFNTGIVDINKSSLYLPRKGVFDDTTKNKTSARSIKLPRFVLDTLQEWKKEQTLLCMQSGTAWIGERGKECKVFTQDNGKPIHPCTVTISFNKFIEKHNLPGASVHSLRHTNATLMIASGVDIRTVSKRLGHAQTSTTTNIYTHAIRTADELASEAIDDILTPKKASRRSG